MEVHDRARLSAQVHQTLTSLTSLLPAGPEDDAEPVPARARENPAFPVPLPQDGSSRHHLIRPQPSVIGKTRYFNSHFKVEATKAQRA